MHVMYYCTWRKISEYFYVFFNLYNVENDFFSFRYYLYIYIYSYNLTARNFLAADVKGKRKNDRSSIIQKIESIFKPVAMFCRTECGWYYFAARLPQNGKNRRKICYCKKFAN